MPYIFLYIVPAGQHQQLTSCYLANAQYGSLKFGVGLFRSAIQFLFESKESKTRNI
jgi:hypothetical protein